MTAIVSRLELVSASGETAITSDFRHSARYLEFRARYNETPTTNANRRLAPIDDVPPGETA